MKIGFLTSGDPRDRRFWSGTPHFMARVLQKNVGTVTFLGPVFPKRIIAGKVFNGLSSRLLRKKYDYTHSIFMAKAYARAFARKLAGQNIEVVIAPAASTEISFLETNIPVVYVSDATFARLVGYYPGLSNLLEFSVREGNEIERRAIHQAALALFSSDWAAQSALHDYRADPAKVAVVPFGANLEEILDPWRVTQRKKNGACRLLFLARNWERKGGAIVFETLMKLEEAGHPAELIVCGCTPPASLLHPQLTVIPFLDKNDPAQGRKLAELFLSSDFMLVPTRADCTPIVFCEAAAFGLPVITTDTGGVSGVIRNGENGYMLPYEAGGADYARLIAEIYADDNRYYELVHSSRKAFEERLNWDAWARAVKRLIAERLGIK